MLLLLFFAFVSGLVTIFAPCIWPLLPIVLSSTVTGEKKKPLGITLGITLSFALFTLTISYFVKLFNFDPNSLRLFAVIVISFLGLTLLISALSRILEGFVSRISSAFGINNSSNGFWGGLITGFSLGLVWSPCAGPILATIATLAATRSVNLEIVLVTVVYVIGLGIPLFIFATIGSHLFTRTRFLSKYTGRIQQIFGIIMILTAVLIYTNYDKVIQIKLLDAIPSYSNFLYKFESSKSVQEQLDKLKDMKEKVKKEMPAVSSALPNLGNAPEFTGINKWLNTDKALSLKSLKGKVVLIDFWTYTCINCIRTLPFVTGWYEKYKDQGFVVVGVHTPEFEFEKKTENVLQAIEQYNIHYPVAQDNDYATWTAYSNQYWPAEYLIDAKGVIRKVHFGEGQYDEMEKAIQELLKEKGSQINQNLIEMPDQTPKAEYSPETYLGSSRMQYYYPSGTINNGKQILTLSKNIPQNSFSLGGEWIVNGDNSVSGQNAVLEYNFFAKKVFLVLRPGSANKIGEVKVFLDGKLVNVFTEGEDVKNGIVTVDKDRLYNLIQLKNPQNHLLKLEFTPGIEVFAFTFG